MIRFSVLASSSKGNCTVISDGETHFLIDAGISATRIRKGLAECGLRAEQLAGIFITHEHGDHVAGLGQLAKKHPQPLRLYCSRYLAADMRAAAPNTVFTYLEPGAAVQLGQLRVTPFAVAHDAIDPLGYAIENGATKLGYVTDTGHITRGVPDLLAGATALYLESNYDPQMLVDSGRAYPLIQRIAGKWGHLSNEQACDFVRSIGHAGLQHLVLAHISPECNTPDKARAAMAATLAELQLPTQLHCAPMATRLPWIEI